jgi:hypothetical protein
MLFAAFIAYCWLAYGYIDAHPTVKALFSSPLFQQRILALQLLPGRNFNIMVASAMLQAIHRVILPCVLCEPIMTLCLWVEIRIVQILLLDVR